MFPHTRIRLLGLAAAAGTLFAMSGSPAPADERPVRLGPVAPHEPILTTVGNKNVIAFYVPGDGYCNIDVVLNDRTDASGNSGAQVRVGLSPREIVHIDAIDNDTLNLKTLNLKCSENATALAVVDSDERIVSDTSPPKAIKASASGF